MRDGMYTIRKLHELHKQENPDSMLSEKAIRMAIKTGSLPAIFVGNRAITSWYAFEQWLHNGLSNEEIKHEKSEVNTDIDKDEKSRL